MSKGYIYLIKNTVTAKCYVGKTTKDIEKRWKEHLYNCDSGKRKQTLYLAMRKYGKENFFIQKIETVNCDVLNDRERYWIKELKTLSPLGYNLTEGGDFGDSNPMHNPDIAKKVSLYFIGDKNPAKRQEVREKIRAASIGRKASEETKRKMSQNENRKYWLGKKHSDETRKKISENHGCRGKFGSLNPNSRKVSRIDQKTGVILETYGSLKEAERWLRENGVESARSSNITECCRQRQKTAYKYKWSYVEEV